MTLNKRALTYVALIAAGLVVFLAVMGIITSGNTAQSADNINREALWTSVTMLILAVAVIASALARRG